MINETRLGVPIARLIFRGADANDGLLIGAVLRSGAHLFQPGTVYELQTDPLDPDVLRLVPKGCAAPARSEKGETYLDSPLRMTWGTNIDRLLTEGGRYLFLSRDELRDVIQRERECDE